MGIVRRLKSVLETPRAERPFGSGWLSGSGALLAGIVGMLLVVVQSYSGWFQTPEIAILHERGYIGLGLRLVLLLGYVLAFLSLLLSRDKLLGGAALGLVVLASVLAGAVPDGVVANKTSLYFGLDFFILNVLFTGFLFIPLEKLFPAYKDQTVFRPEWQEDMFYYFVSSMMVQVLTFLTMAPANFVSQEFDLAGIRSFVATIPFAGQVVIIMILTDFVQYWLHRMFHQVPFLWRFHAVHHSAKSMDWLAGARMHFVEIAVLRGLTAVPMFTLGFDPGAIQVYVLLVYFYSSFVHANVGWKLSFIERFVVTPRFHHWHHGKERDAIDVNFAVHFPLYDWLFGTYHLPKDKWPDGYGVAGEPVPRGYWRQFLFPFTKPKKY